MLGTSDAFLAQLILDLDGPDNPKVFNLSATNVLVLTHLPIVDQRSLDIRRRIGCLVVTTPRSVILDSDTRVHLTPRLTLGRRAVN